MNMCTEEDLSVVKHFYMEKGEETHTRCHEKVTVKRPYQRANANV